jgi:hypothetical protein
MLPRFAKERLAELANDEALDAVAAVGDDEKHHT